jgi:acyl-CoA dehydrogenase
MKVIKKIGLPDLPCSWFDADLSEEEKNIQQTIHEFADKVIRPEVTALDKLSPEEVVAKNSRWFQLREKYLELGLDYKAFDGMSSVEASRIQSLAIEELGWGDMGFTIGMMVDQFPSLISHAMGRADLAEKYKDKIGCWIVTQPDRSSDAIDFLGNEMGAGAKHHRGNLHSRLEGDKLIINGQSSAWVSLGPIAEVAVLMTQCDYGDGLWREDDTLNSMVTVVDLDHPGVSRGKPLDKMGQRALPQGEIYFDNVEVPADNMLIGKDEANAGTFSILSEGATVHSAAATGVARAAFEHAMEYVHERRMGGVPLIEHQLVRHRIFKMFERVETARALSRRAWNYFGHAKDPDMAIAITAKVHCTKAAFDVASEAIQLFGGVGLTKDYPVEKLLRDARSTMIEDGENHVLGLAAANRIIEIYRASR